MRVLWLNPVRRFWNRYFMGLQLLIAIAAVLLFVLWTHYWGGNQPVNVVLDNNRPAIYGTLASISGSLLGFAITAVSIILGYSTSDKMAIVRESKQYPMLWRLFTSAIRALGLATIVSLIGMVIDRDTSPAWLILYLTLGITVFAGFRLANCLWALENVIAIVTQPSKERVGGQG